MKIKWERTFFSVWIRVVLNCSLRSKRMLTLFSPENAISVEILFRCRMPWVWYHIKNPPLNMADYDICHQWYHRKCENIPCENFHENKLVEWHCSDCNCSEVTKEHKKKGWNLFVIITLNVVATLILVLLPLFSALNIFKSFLLRLYCWLWAYIGF